MVNCAKFMASERGWNNFSKGKPATVFKRVIGKQTASFTTAANSSKMRTKKFLVAFSE
jgi:hypothetical protein